MSCFVRTYLFCLHYGNKVVNSSVRDYDCTTHTFLFFLFFLLRSFHKLSIECTGSVSNKTKRKNNNLVNLSTKINLRLKLVFLTIILTLRVFDGKLENDVFTMLMASSICLLTSTCIYELSVLYTFKVLYSRNLLSDSDFSG